MVILNSTTKKGNKDFLIKEVLPTNTNKITTKYKRHKGCRHVSVAQHAISIHTFEHNQNSNKSKFHISSKYKNSK